MAAKQNKKLKTRSTGLGLPFSTDWGTITAARDKGTGRDKGADGSSLEFLDPQMSHEEYDAFMRGYESFWGRIRDVEEREKAATEKEKVLQNKEEEPTAVEDALKRGSESLG
ncbi:hypothetical protein DL768_008278 [Monosporascus sp. mg162]|nr:hypothetical protein DL768_008278 [Monosporascus sp. mg162]